MSERKYDSSVKKILNATAGISSVRKFAMKAEMLSRIKEHKKTVATASPSIEETKQAWLVDKSYKPSIRYSDHNLHFEMPPIGKVKQKMPKKQPRRK